MGVRFCNFLSLIYFPIHTGPLSFSCLADFQVPLVALTAWTFFDDPSAQAGFFSYFFHSYSLLCFI